MYLKGIKGKKKSTKSAASETYKTMKGVKILKMGIVEDNGESCYFDISEGKKVERVYTKNDEQKKLLKKCIVSKSYVESINIDICLYDMGNMGPNLNVMNDEGGIKKYKCKLLISGIEIYPKNVKIQNVGDKNANAPLVY